MGAHQAHAGLWDILTKPGQAVTLLFAWLMEIILTFFSKFLGLAMSLLEAIFKIGRFSKVPVVQAGWQITRGLANMFFALILLIMAVSTVLGMESFGARRILVRLIIAALLINFSLLFGGIIIDFSQVLTDYFITAAGGTAIGTAGQSSISTQLANGLNIARVFADPNQFETLMAGGDASRLVNMGVGMLFGIIIIAVATFVVLAAALFLIIRVAVLWLLLIFAPLAWVSMVVPGGMAGSIWGMWWKSFFQWAFFAPIYAFFLYLAVMAIGSNSLAQAFVNAQINAAQSGFLTGFLNGTISLVLQYIVILIILCGGLLVAQKFGIYGAGAVISAGKRAGKGVAKWSGRQAARPISAGYDAAKAKAASAAGTVLGVVGLKTYGERLKAKSTQIKQEREQRKEHKDYEKLLKTMSKDGVVNEVENARGIRALIAARTAKEMGYLKTADTKTTQKAMDTFKTFGAHKEQRELEEMRPDAIKDETARDAAIQRAIASGEYKRWGKQVFEGTGGQKIMETLQTQLPPGEFISAFQGWSRQVKDAAEKAMKANFSDGSYDSTDEQEIKRRNLYASSTNKITDAFANKKTGTMDSSGEAAAAAHIQKRTAAQIGSVYADNKDDLKLVGKHMTQEQIASVRAELSGVQKQLIVQGARESNNVVVVKYADNSLAWGGRESPKEEEKPRIVVAGKYTPTPPPEERKIIT